MIELRMVKFVVLIGVLTLALPSLSSAQQIRGENLPSLVSASRHSSDQLNRGSFTMSSDDDNWDDRFDALGVDGAVLAVAVSGTDIYVGGVFSTVGSVSANNIAKWDGSGWSALGSGGTNGTSGTVLAIAVNGNDVLVGGSFSSAGGVAVNNIAKWNGSNWSALGSGVENGDVRSITFNANDTYVGGVFSTAGGQAISNIAKWDGNNWSALDSGVNGPAYALVAHNGELYVGGSFTQAGGSNASNIAKWNFSTTSWSSVGSGFNLDVNALVSDGTNIYAGGLFTTAGSEDTKKVAMWDGSSWSPLGGGITGGDVNAVTLIGNNLFVGGTFTSAGSVNANRVAKWDGSGWSALGTGITGGFVFGLTADVSAGNLYAGGSFDTAGGKISNKFARWTDPGGAVPVELVSFSAQANGRIVELNWSTATERDNFGFDIERKNENAWQKIAFVRGHGTTTQERHYSYLDNVQGLTVNGNAAVSYRLKQIDLDGSFEYSPTIEVTLGELPEGVILAQNYPNPFNPTTTIEFVIPEDGFTTLKVYNLLGHEVRTLVSRDMSADKVHRINFDAKSLATGTYVYVISSGNPAKVVRRTMLLLR